MEKKKDSEKVKKGIKGKNKLVLEVNGLHCADCALNIERSIRHQPGILDATVNYLNQEATVYYDTFRVSEEKIKKAILKPGYEIRESSIDKTKSFLGRYIHALLTFLSGIILLFAWILSWFGLDVLIYFGLEISEFLSLLSLLIGGYFIFKIALKTLLVFDLNVNVLVSFAALGAVYLGDFLEAATVIFIMNLGEFLEHFTSGKTRKAISSLLKITPQYALVKKGDKEIRVAASDLKQGDVIILEPGERVAIDGDIIKGDGMVNQSLITGESMPVYLSESEEVYSGTVLEEGYMEIRATKVGENTTLAQIKKLIIEAESSKAPIQRITDRYARYFIPVIFITAFGVLLFTGELARAITLLVVACPCALVLGTPTAIVAGIGRAAKSGILVKSGIHIETAGNINAILLDKTGTLTYGIPEIKEIKAFNDSDEKEVLSLAAIGEKRSEHPLAKAVLKAAEDKGLEIANPDDFKIFRGKGVIVNQNKKKIIIGNKSLMKEKEVKIDPNVEIYLSKTESKGQTCLLVAKNSQIIGAIAISDQPKERASKAIQRLKNSGINRVAMITGDNPRVANSLGESLDIQEIYAEMLPEDKLKKVREIIDQGYITAMVGDGVNDAPSLAAANIGIAMGAKGTDVAIESSDIALMTDDLLRLAETVIIGKKTLNVIRQNLIFALVFNFLMVILASLGIISIIIGAIFHQISSLGVILNSMRLLRIQLKNS